MIPYLHKFDTIGSHGSSIPLLLFLHNWILQQTKDRIRSRMSRSRNWAVAALILLLLLGNLPWICDAQDVEVNSKDGVAFKATSNKPSLPLPLKREDILSMLRKAAELNENLWDDGKSYVHKFPSNREYRMHVFTQRFCRTYRNQPPTKILSLSPKIVKPKASRDTMFPPLATNVPCPRSASIPSFTTLVLTTLVPALDRNYEGETLLKKQTVLAVYETPEDTFWPVISSSIYYVIDKPGHNPEWLQKEVELFLKHPKRTRLH